MINPNDISTVSVGQLPDGTFALTNKIAHEIGTELYRGTIQELCVFISNYIGTADGVGFRAVTVTDGQTLPTTTQQEFILVGKGTYYNVEGGSTLILTEELNAIVSNGTYWFVGVEIPVNVELAGITQFIRSGFISTTPSESAVFDALALKADLTDVEDVANKTSAISGYSETLYPNEKASHDALDLKLNISDLPTNLTLYPTTTASDVSGYVVMVKDIHDVRYNTTAVDVSTPTITTTDQLVSQRISDAGILIGQPGVFNITTFGNIRHLSGSGSATFYFKVFHRDSAGVETLICTSSISNPVTNGGYSEFTASGVWDDGDFVASDRIVIKSYANRIAGGSDPVYQFQFGGTSPVRTLLPVPFSVVDAGYELSANKQNSLAIDGTGTKYPTVDAVNAIDLQKVLDTGSYAEIISANQTGYTSLLHDYNGEEDLDFKVTIRDNTDTNNFSAIRTEYDRVEISSNNNSLGKISVIQVSGGIARITQRDGIYATNIEASSPIENTTINFPAKTVAGDYTLATTDDIDTQINGTINYIPKFIGGNSIGNSLLRDDGLRIDAGNLTGIVNNSTNDYIFNIHNVTNNNNKRLSLFSVNSDLESTISDNTLGMRGIWSRLSINSVNTKNWGQIAAVGGEIVSEVGSSGTISEMTAFRISIGNASDDLTVNNVYGIKSNYLNLDKPTINTAGLAFPQIANSTNSTQLLLGTTTVPSGHYAIHDVTGYNSLFSGKIKYAGDYSSTYDARTLVDKGYTDAKITQTITNGVTDKSPSEDAVFDNLANVTRTLIKSTTTGSLITGTISQTILYSQLIPANTFKNGDFFNIEIARIGKTGTAGTLRNTIYINTSNTLPGSIMIAYNVGSTANLYIPIQRIFSIENNNLVGMSASQFSSDIINVSAPITSYAFNPTIDNYIFVTGTMTSASDSMFFSSLKISN